MRHDPDEQIPFDVPPPAQVQTFAPAAVTLFGLAMREESPATPDTRVWRVDSLGSASPFDLQLLRHADGSWSLSVALNVARSSDEARSTVKHIVWDQGSSESAETAWLASASRHVPHLCALVVDGMARGIAKQLVA